MIKILWIGRAGFGFVWRGTEHQFYRNVDGSMAKRWTHHSFPLDHECVMNEHALELAQCHGGMVWCSICFTLVRHYSPLRINPRTEPCPHPLWIPTAEDLEEVERDREYRQAVANVLDWTS